MYIYVDKYTYTYIYIYIITVYIHDTRETYVLLFNKLMSSNILKG